MYATYLVQYKTCNNALDSRQLEWEKNDSSKAKEKVKLGSGQRKTNESLQVRAFPNNHFAPTITYQSAILLVVE